MAFKMRGFGGYSPQHQQKMGMASGDNMMSKNSAFLKEKTAYEKALENDPNLEKYFAERKKYKAGSAEYEEIQAKINKAYGKTRDEDLKAAQVKKHAKDESRSEGTKVEPVKKPEEKKEEVVEKSKTQTASATEHQTSKSARGQKKAQKKGTRAAIKAAIAAHGRGSKQHKDAIAAHKQMKDVKVKDIKAERAAAAKPEEKKEEEVKTGDTSDIFAKKYK
jgi:hypothetical protein